MEVRKETNPGAPHEEARAVFKKPNLSEGMDRTKNKRQKHSGQASEENDCSLRP